MVLVVAETDDDDDDTSNESGRCEQEAYDAVAGYSRLLLVEEDPAPARLRNDEQREGATSSDEELILF